MAVHFASAATLYVDGLSGHNLRDGSTNVMVAGTNHGPFLNISAGIAAAADGDTLVVAPGYYQELTWDPGAKNLTIVPVGSVTVYASDPWVTDSDGDGISDGWEFANGLNATNNADANQTSGHSFAHGLTNLQVYRNQSVLIADGYSTVGDGIPDWWKVKHGLPLDDPAVGVGDADHDGFTNAREYQGGTDPTDPNDHPGFQDFATWWTLDEGTGSNTVSRIATNLTGALVGDPLPDWSGGVYSNALAFDGLQNEVLVPDTPALTPSNALTLAVWVRTATNLTSEVIAKWNTNGTSGGSYLLSLTNGHVALELMLAGNYTGVVGQASSLSDTNWHHIAGSYDGEQMRVYLDGEAVGTSPATGTVDSIDAPLRFGLLAGQLDDARQYNIAVSSENLLALYAADAVGDGVADWWRSRYFGQGPVTNTQSCAGCDPDGDGFSNFEEYLAGTEPMNVNSRPSGHQASALTIPNSWAIYLSPTLVQVTADIRSTNQNVTVKAAEMFIDFPGTTGNGIPLTLGNAGRNSTNVTATVSFTPTFPYGQRHELFVHAQGKDKRWSPFTKVIINPNVNDILDKIQTNYSQIHDITYTVTVKQYTEYTVEDTQTVVFRQKSSYKMRWENQTSGAVTIMNHNQFNVIDENGQLTPFTIVFNEDSSAEVNKQTHFYWDVSRFKAQHYLGTTTAITNQLGSYRLSATPTTNFPAFYGLMNCDVDFRVGVVTSVSYAEPTSGGLRINQGRPVEILSGVWFHSEHDWRLEPDTDWELRRQEQIQTSTIEINTGEVPDSLFDIQ